MPCQSMGSIEIKPFDVVKMSLSYAMEILKIDRQDETYKDLIFPRYNLEEQQDHLKKIYEQKTSNSVSDPPKPATAPTLPIASPDLCPETKKETQPSISMPSQTSSAQEALSDREPTEQPSPSTMDRESEMQQDAVHSPAVDDREESYEAQCVGAEGEQNDVGMEQDIVEEAQKETPKKKSLKRQRPLSHELLSDYESDIESTDEEYESQSDPELSSEDEDSEVVYSSEGETGDGYEDLPLRRSTRKKQPPKGDMYLDLIANDKGYKEIQSHVNSIRSGAHLNEEFLVNSSDDEEDKEESENKPRKKRRHSTKHLDSEDEGDDCTEDVRKMMAKEEENMKKEWLSIYVKVHALMVGCPEQVDLILSKKVPDTTNQEIFNSWSDEKQYAFGYYHTKTRIDEILKKLRRSVKGSHMEEVLNLLKETQKACSVHVCKLKVQKEKKEIVSDLTGLTVPMRKARRVTCGKLQFNMEAEHATSIWLLYLLINFDRVMCGIMLDLIKERHCISESHPERAAVEFTKGLDGNICKATENQLRILMQHAEKMSEFFAKYNQT